MKILLVEDDLKLSKLIAAYLSQYQFSVEWEKQGDHAVYRILHEHYDLVILDINLPEMNGLQVCKMVRNDYAGFILMLTAREADEDQITGLEYGADDFVKKPIQPPVLLARIQALLRRKEPHRMKSNEISYGKLKIDLQQRLVLLDGHKIDLKPKEYDLLVLLATHAGTSLTRDNIMHALRGIDYDGIDRTIDLRISYLRQKLGDNPDHPFRIQTIRNKGYVFQPDAWD